MKCDCEKLGVCMGKGTSTHRYSCTNDVTNFFILPLTEKYYHFCDECTTRFLQYNNVVVKSSKEEFIVAKVMTS